MKEAGSEFYATGFLFCTNVIILNLTNVMTFPEFLKNNNWISIIKMHHRGIKKGE